MLGYFPMHIRIAKTTLPDPERFIQRAGYAILRDRDNRINNCPNAYGH
jgi:hypothetical protein